MAARLGLMGLGPGPAQASPPHERSRVGVGVEGVIEVKETDRGRRDER